MRPSRFSAFHLRKELRLQRAVFLAPVGIEHELIVGQDAGPA